LQPQRTSLYGIQLCSTILTSVKKKYSPGRWEICSIGGIKEVRTTKIHDRNVTVNFKRGEYTDEKVFIPSVTQAVWKKKSEDCSTPFGSICIFSLELPVSLTE